jgi:2'-5' RNA ligase
MTYGLGIPLPGDYARRIERFRVEKAEWAVRPMRSDPHISIKGPAGLSDVQDVLAPVASVASATEKFTIQLAGPSMFDHGPILYLGVESAGWWRLHRALVDVIAEKTGEEMHPWEIEGWIPHTTVIRVRPELRERRDDIICAAEEALSPLPLFRAGILRMYRQEPLEARWTHFHDFPMGLERTAYDSETRLWGLGAP